MIKRLLYFMLAGMVSVLAVFCAVRLCIIGQDRVPVGIGVPKAEDTVNAFCEALNYGDLQTVEGLIYGYSSLNLTAQPESGNTEQLLECLRSSYSSEPSGEPINLGTTVMQDVTVEYFSVSLAAEGMKARTEELFNERIDGAERNEELYDEKGDILESVVLELYDQAVGEVIGRYEEYMVSQTVTLELVYENGEWQILLSDQLVNMLLGGINNC